MATMFCIGTYSSTAMKGFVANPTQDRKRIVEAMTASTGIKMIDFQITRGIFDFVAVARERLSKLWRSRSLWDLQDHSINFIF